VSAPQELEQALEPLRSMLAADGYALATSDSQDGSAIVLDVTATPEACAECLAPASVIASVARSCLADSSIAPGVAIEVRVPEKGSDEQGGLHTRARQL
jgi:hypothetical protein